MSKVLSGIPQKQNMELFFSSSLPAYNFVINFKVIATQLNYAHTFLLTLT